MAFIESVQYSPGVKVREIDLSAYAPLYAPVFIGIVGTAKKGFTDKLNFVGNVYQMFETLGKPRPADYGLWATYYALRAGASVYFARVVGAGAHKAQAVAVDENNEPCLTLSAVSEGDWGNELSVVISKLSDTSYRLKVLYDNRVVHSYDYVSTDVNSPYHLSKLLENSEYVRVVSATGQAPKSQTVAFTGGADGATPTSTDVLNALRLFSNREEVDVDTITAPGWFTDDVVSQLITIVETRKDSIAIIDPPPSLSPLQVKDWVNGAGLSRPALNTSYGALYYPWLKIVDEFGGGSIWVPPSVGVLYAITNNDFYGSHFAPAGLKRGKLPFVIGVERKLTLGDRELLQSPDARVNPIIDNPKFGAVVWGQKTLQVAPTALDRLNVRRYLIQLEKSLASLAMNFIFEPNTPSTRKLFVQEAIKILEYSKQIEAISSYTIQCDEQVNPPTLVDNNIMRAVITVVPVKSAERIWIDVVLTGSQGVQFNVSA